MGKKGPDKEPERRRKGPGRRSRDEVMAQVLYHLSEAVRLLSEELGRA